MHLNPSNWTFSLPPLMVVPNVTKTITTPWSWPFTLNNAAVSMGSAAMSSGPAASSNRTSARASFDNSMSVSSANAISSIVSFTNSSSITNTITGTLSQGLGSIPLPTNSTCYPSCRTSSQRLSTSFSASISATTSSSASTGVSEGAGSMQNTAATPNTVYNVLYAVLLALLVLLILAIIYFLWKSDRRRKATDSADDSQEETPLNASIFPARESLNANSFPARSSYAPSDFFTRMSGFNTKGRAGGGYAAIKGLSSEIPPGRQGGLWSKIAAVGGNKTHPIPGHLRENKVDSNSDVDSLTPLPAPIIATPSSPVKRNAISRMFSTQKEFKSPRPARFLPKSSATSSTVDNGYCAYSALNAGQTEDAATDRSQNETAFGQSAQAYGPLPPPLRKRKFPKTVIGAPNAQDPIVPGEMAGKVAVPLIPIEEARARARARAGAAISRSGLPLMEQIREEQVMESGGVPTPLVRRAQSPKSPMMFAGNTHRKSQTGRAQFAASSQNSQARSITNISRSASANQTRSGAITSRPASALKLPFIPGHGVEGGAEGGDFVRWTPTPPRITTPLVNELRKNLLPRRLAIIGKSSHSPEHRGPDISERPLRPGMRKRSVTAPSALLNPQADRGESALSPLDLPDLPNLPGNPFLQAESRKTNQSGDKSDADLSPTATGRPAVDELRESDFKWSAKAHDDQRASHPSFATSLGSGYDTGHEVRGQDSADSVHDSDEEREHVSELHSASFRYQAGDSESRSSTTRRTSTIWSQSSGISENVSQDGSDRASAMESIILAPIQPLDLSPDKSRRRLPVPPCRDSTVGGEDETRTAKPELSGGAQFSPNLNFLPPTVRNGPSRRMGSLAPSVTAFSSPRQEPSTIPVPSAREDNTSFSPPSTAKTATTEVTAVSTSSNRRVSTSRKRVPVDLLNEIEAEQHQFTAQKPAPKSPMSVAEESKLKTRFSDQVSFSDGGEFAFSPPSGTVGLITPPPLLVYPGSNRQSPEILAPRPITRRRNMMPPDHVIPPFASSHSGVYGAAKKPALPEAVTPSSDAQAPKAVQTRETWRQIRKSSVTGYYLQVAQDEGDSPEIHDDEEDENVLLR